MSDKDPDRNEVSSSEADADSKESFLLSMAAGALFAEEEPDEPLREESGNIAAGEFVGPYKLVERVGEGGFGEVWKAEQIEPVRRQVALKLIKEGMDSKQFVLRFEVERQALAKMNHPNIAKVFDAGVTIKGRPYFVMEFVEGVPITEYCDKHRLNTRERIELFMQVCEGIQHAHQKGVIHRDLKPSNTLVSREEDGDPQPRVIDFGLAKATHGGLTQNLNLTVPAQILGTPAYMSPEQANRRTLEMDATSDIYSLGVLLYELLTGTLPIDRKELRKAGEAGMAKLIEEKEPPKPSRRIAAIGEEDLQRIASLRGVSPEKLGRFLRNDLDWVVLKALEKEQARRYSTADELRRDLMRFLAGEPVSAGPASASYRVSKFVKRHRVMVGAALAVVLALVVGIVGTSTQAYIANRAMRDVIQRDAQLREERYYRGVRIASLLLSSDETEAAREMLLSLPENMRNVEWDLLLELCGPSALRLPLDQDPARHYIGDPEVARALSAAWSEAKEGREHDGSNEGGVDHSGGVLWAAFLKQGRHPWQWEGGPYLSVFRKGFDEPVTSFEAGLTSRIHGAAFTSDGSMIAIIADSMAGFQVFEEERESVFYLAVPNKIAAGNSPEPTEPLPVGRLHPETWNWSKAEELYFDVSDYGGRGMVVADEYTIGGNSLGNLFLGGDLLATSLIVLDLEHSAGVLQGGWHWDNMSMPLSSQERDALLNIEELEPDVQRTCVQAELQEGVVKGLFMVRRGASAAEWWDISNGKLICVLGDPFKGSGNMESKLYAISSDATMAAICPVGRLNADEESVDRGAVFDLSTGKRLCELEAKLRPQLRFGERTLDETCGFSPGGKFLYIAWQGTDSEGVMKVFSVRDGQEVELSKVGSPSDSRTPDDWWLWGISRSFTRKSDRRIYHLLAHTRGDSISDDRYLYEGSIYRGGSMEPVVSLPFNCVWVGQDLSRAILKNDPTEVIICRGAARRARLSSMKDRSGLTTAERMLLDQIGRADVSSMK